MQLWRYTLAIVSLALGGTIWFVGAGQSGAKPTRPPQLSARPIAAPAPTASGTSTRSVQQTPSLNQPHQTDQAGEALNLALKLAKEWPDGTRVYRQGGLQVTVLASGELLYLPDEI